MLLVDRAEQKKDEEWGTGKQLCRTHRRGTGWRATELRWVL